MVLQFTLIQETKQNRQEVIENCLAFLNANEKHRVFYITPDHMKFDMETEVLRQMSQHKVTEAYVSMMRFGVYSFRRLLWFFNQKADRTEQMELSSIGNMMIIQKVLLELEAELKRYKGEVKRVGFVQKLNQLFSELKEGNISSNDLSHILNVIDSGDNALLENQQDKIKELGMIFERYETFVRENKLKEENIYDDLIAYLADADLSHVYVVVDGFYALNAGEKRVIAALLASCHQLNMVLMLNRPFIDGPPKWYDTFMQTGQTYYQLYHYAKDHNIPILTDGYGASNKDLVSGMPILNHYFMQQSRNTWFSVETEEKEKVQQAVDVFKAESIYLESREVANRIFQLVTTGDYRFKDIQILMRDQAIYQDSLLPELRRNAIPYFVDNVDTMESHPLYRFFKALHRIYRYNWRYEDVMDLMRSELWIPDFLKADDPEVTLNQYREAVDLTENVILKNGYEGRFWWQKDKTWSYLFVDENGEKIGNSRDITIEKQANQLRQFYSRELTALFQLWDEEQLTDASIHSFYTLLNKWQLKEQLAIWRDQLIEQGDLELGRHHEQAWQTFTQMIDDYHAIFKDAPFDCDQFFALLDIAFKEATYSIIPPTMDSVSVSGIDSQRLHPKKVTFVMGLTKRALPKMYREESLLTTEDRDILSPHLTWDQGLKPHVKFLSNNERFIAYRTFLSATEQLILSYPYNDANDTFAEASVYLQQLIEAFDLEVTKVHQEISSQTLGNWRSQMSAFIDLARDYSQRNESIPIRWKEIYTRLLSDDQSKSAFQQNLNGLAYANHVGDLSAELASRLYGETLFVSVSQLELYNRDPFSYFLKYGLKLRERPTFELDKLQTGNYYHAVLDAFFKEMHVQGKTFTDLSKEEREAILNQIVKDYQSTEKYPEFTIFETSPIHQNIRVAMQETLSYMLEQMNRQYNLVQMQNRETELTFGFNPKQTNVWFDDDAGIKLRGKIDRVDELTYNGDKYLQIVDYKSSQQALDFTKIYDGRQMQLLTYLATGQQLDGEAPKPLGGFYQSISDGFVRIKEQKDLNQNLDEVRLKDSKLSGFILGDIPMLEVLDRSFAPGETSLVYPIRLKKNGEFYANVPYLTMDEWTEILNYVKAKVKATAQQIKEGHIALKPYKDDLFIPSLNMPYRSVSLFDTSDRRNQYRDSQKIENKKMFLEKIEHQNENEGESKNG